jgi:hypothetical protein
MGTIVVTDAAGGVDVAVNLQAGFGFVDTGAGAGASFSLPEPQSDDHLFSHHDGLVYTNVIERTNRLQGLMRATD